VYSNEAAIQNQLSTSLFDNVPIAVYTCDSQGYIASFNIAAADLWGRKPKLGEDMWCGSWKIYDPDGAPLSLDACPMARTLKNGMAIEGEEIIVERPDGTKRNVLPHPVPLFNAAGDLTGAINTLIDITELKKGEEKQAMLAAIIESSDDAIISKTLDGIITSWNRAAEFMLGYSEKEAVGRHISLLIPKNRLAEETLIIEQIRKGQKIDHYETIRLTKGGEEIPISLTVSPIRSQSGRIIGASKIARDIKRQKATEEELRQHTENLAKLYDEIKNLNAKKDEFIGIASHELKTPLTSMKGYLQLLERNLVDETDLGFVSKALRQLNNLSNLVSDLLDVSKIQSGKLQLSMGTFDFHAVMLETIEVTQQSVSSHRLVLQSEGVPLLIHADRHRIEQVLNNLINNAVKYSPKSELVDIQVTQSSNDLTVMVKDYGIGISRESQEHIFSRFYRAEGLDPHMSGLGLGLYITKEIIDRHHGKIRVNSEPGKGSAFYFTIPVSAH
jgi:PAS domain S-box-containing protein